MKVVVKVGDRVFEVDIENTSSRPIVAMVEGERFEVWPENPTQSPTSSESTTQTGVDRLVPPTVEKSSDECSQRKLEREDHDLPSARNGDRGVRKSRRSGRVGTCRPCH